MTKNILHITTLHDLLEQDIRKFSSGETQLKNILPDWIDTTHSSALKNVLRRYLNYVQQNTQSLQDFIIRESIDSLARIDNVMLALIREAREKLSNCTDIEIRDACLLACVQSINDYKISLYSTAAEFAKIIGDVRYARIFHDAEINEKLIDEMLTPLAENEINTKARRRNSSCSTGCFVTSLS